MELISSKKMGEMVFCDLCEKERKHVINTYQDFSDSNEAYTLTFQKCKACGKEKEMI